MVIDLNGLNERGFILRQKGIDRKGIGLVRGDARRDETRDVKPRNLNRRTDLGMMGSRAAFEGGRA